MLAEAEANWDGIARLDRIAADYFNCEDTPLNRAFVRKTMIAGVARVRNPGCKFDTILVLEAKEGENKSTAWRVLAGDENFSDEKIIGKDSREVQEQLAGVWIHENAELAGMRKAELDTVKAFASRQVDRARPAFGHFLKKQARHSIEVGTTNADTYLLSQTGNRRFWPMRVLKTIDLDKLKRDRLQLWGEAAHYQSQGEALTIDEKMWPDAGIEQEKRRVKDPWEDVLENMTEVVEKRIWDGEREVYISTEVHHIIIHVDDQERAASDAILAHVLKIPIGQQTTADAMRLATVMKLLGWERPSNGKITIEGRRVQGYFRRVECSDDEPE
jgi:predicted P-loop ATPase